MIEFDYSGVAIPEHTGEEEITFAENRITKCVKTAFKVNEYRLLSILKKYLLVVRKVL